MQGMLNIGNDYGKNKDSAAEAAKAIVLIFKSAREHTMDQATVVESLHALSQIAEIKNISIAHNCFTNNAQEDAAVAPPRDQTDEGDIEDA